MRIDRSTWAAALSLVLSSVAAAATPSWPSFRGPGATGVVKEADPPVKWDVAAGTNVRWKTPIPGLAHSSPIVWGDRVFVTTAVSNDPDPLLKVGLYGESPKHPEEIPHEWKVYALDRTDGTVRWEQTAHTGIPKVKRHIKSTHANCTPATDGKHVVAFFGSEGLYCYDMDGKLLWKQDLGLLDAGAFNVPELQWGFGSSPIIYKNLAIVQCDVNNQSFLAAYNLDDGKRAWHTPRDTLPSWATPTVHASADRAELIVNGTPDICGYDPATGKQRWKLTGSSLITTPTPFVAHDLIYIASGYRPIKPIYAIRVGAEGDISLQNGATSNSHIAWSKRSGGSYMPTPIVYGEHLYVCRDNGVLSCYEARTGKRLYQKRLGERGGAFTSSPVAASGRIYFTSEDGDVFVVQAGTDYKLLAENALGEICLATPAIADDTLIFRTRHHVVAIGK